MIKTSILERFCYADYGTFGWLTTPSGKLYAVVERPWLDNRVGESCVPKGLYACRPRRYYRGGYDAIEVAGVTGRTFIMMHIANHPNACNLR